MPDHWPRAHWIQPLQKEEPFSSLWIIQSGSPLALQAWGSVENEPARPPAPFGTQRAGSILGKKTVPNYDPCFDLCLLMAARAATAGAGSA